MTKKVRKGQAGEIPELELGDGQFAVFSLLFSGSSTEYLVIYRYMHNTSLGMQQRVLVNLIPKGVAVTRRFVTTEQFEQIPDIGVRPKFFWDPHWPVSPRRETSDDEQ